MPEITIIGREIWFDGQHVADLAPGVAEGTSLHQDFVERLERANAAIAEALEQPEPRTKAQRLKRK